ncbi:MAG: putative sugar nucleotidyl transferase [Gemmatimonadaceae bacterium]
MTAPPLYLYDDAIARTFEPFALTRPFGEMRAGTSLIRARWEHAFGTRAAGTVAAEHLVDFEESDAPAAAAGTIPAGAILANTRCVMPVSWRTRDADVWTCDGRVAAVRLAKPLPVDHLAGGSEPLESLGTAGTRVEAVRGRWIGEVWELITGLATLLAQDIDRLGPRLELMPTDGLHVLGSGAIYLELGATLEPLVVIDVTAGPVLVRRGATIRSFTRLVGPCAVASGATVLGDRVAGCSIGEGSMIRGEISETVILGNVNKSHDGFVGHSYLGRWVNLGAGTVTSNLKNTYGSVALWTPKGVRDTGTQKLGTLFGDHVKTGIGLRVTTGSVVGAGSNVYGSVMPPSFVPPFSWGDGAALGPYRLDKFLATAERAMGRRNVALSERMRRQLSAAYERGRAGAA